MSVSSLLESHMIW